MLELLYIHVSVDSPEAQVNRKQAKGGYGYMYVRRFVLTVDTEKHPPEHTSFLFPVQPERALPFTAMQVVSFPIHISAAIEQSSTAISSKNVSRVLIFFINTFLWGA